MIADPERHAYAAQIATMMDARKDRIGDHAAEHAPPWAVAALGPVPWHPLDRLDWQRRAASIGAWRELSGHDDSADPIGPEPVAAPDARAAWHEALAALGSVDGPDVRGMPDGSQGCCTCATPIRSRPPGRRHADQHYPPLHSAEPEPVTPAQRHELDLTAGEPPGEMGQWIKQLAAGHRDFAGRLAGRQSQTIPSEDPDYGDLGLAFPPWTGPARDAILRPPKPEIRPSRRSSSV